MEAMSELRQAHRTAALIAGGLIMSLVMYAVIANVFRVTQAPFAGVASLPERHVRLARYAAWIASAAVVVGLPAFRRVLLRRRPDDTRATAIARLTLTTVAVGGLSELPAVAGFVLVVLGGAVPGFLPPRLALARAAARELPPIRGVGRVARHAGAAALA
jgi:hypothetical protein